MWITPEGNARGICTNPERHGLSGMTDRTFFRPLFLAATALLASCSFSVRSIYKDEEKRVAARAVERIHQRLNAEQYGELYDEAHALFKNLAGKAEMTAA